MDAALGDGAVEFLDLREAGQHRRHLGDHVLEGSGADVAAAVALGDGDDADRQRHPGADAVGHAAAAAVRRRREIEPDQFRRAAADVEEEDAGWRRDRSARRSRRRQGAPRSRARRSPARGRSRLRTRVEELRAVLGRAAGFGGDQAGAADVAVGKLGAADAERLDGARHGGVGEPAVGADALAEADDAREGIDDAEAVVARASRPAGGNCWCRDRARHRAARRGRSRRVRRRQPGRRHHRRRSRRSPLTGVPSSAAPLTFHAVERWCRWPDGGARSTASRASAHRPGRGGGAGSFCACVLAARRRADRRRGPGFGPHGTCRGRIIRATGGPVRAMRIIARRQKSKSFRRRCSYAPPQPAPRASPVTFLDQSSRRGRLTSGADPANSRAIPPGTVQEASPALNEAAFARGRCD